MRSLKPERSAELFGRARELYLAGVLARRFTVDQAAAVLQVSRRTAWRFLNHLVKNRLAVPVGEAQHELKEPVL